VRKRSDSKQEEEKKEKEEGSSHEMIGTIPPI
jgi:hypothetical protein